MNPNISKLSSISRKKKRTIIGLMSGTSLDGLDIALCSVKGAGTDTGVNLIHFVTKEYEDEIAEELRKISSVEQADLSDVCYLHTRLARLHAEWILEALEEWGVNPAKVDCIASHGQTIYHYPARDQQEKKIPLNTTLQIGDGDHIAAITGILTISDFRQKHTAHNGEGAPMAGLIDNMLFRDPIESRVLLNIGGIGNYTYLPVSINKNHEAFTTDTGPGNTLIDKCAQIFFDRPFDKDSEIAVSGQVNQNLLDELLNDPWFSGSGSKTTGPEYFSMDWLKERIKQAGLCEYDIKPENLSDQMNQYENLSDHKNKHEDLREHEFKTENLSEHKVKHEDVSGHKITPEDLVRTVTELSAVTIADHIKSTCSESDFAHAVYISGGGARNPLLVERLTSLLPGFSIENFSKLGVDPDAKEAVLFAVLANEMLAGEGFLFHAENSKTENRNENRIRLNFGKISFPN